MILDNCLNRFLKHLIFNKSTLNKNLLCFVANTAAVNNEDHFGNNKDG